MPKISSNENTIVEKYVKKWKLHRSRGNGRTSSASTSPNSLLYRVLKKTVTDKQAAITAPTANTYGHIQVLRKSSRIIAEIKRKQKVKREAEHQRKLDEVRKHENVVQLGKDALNNIRADTDKQAAITAPTANTNGNIQVLRKSSRIIAEIKRKQKVKREAEHQRKLDEVRKPENVVHLGKDALNNIRADTDKQAAITAPTANTYGHIQVLRKSSRIIAEIKRKQKVKREAEHQRKLDEVRKPENVVHLGKDALNNIRAEETLANSQAMGLQLEQTAAKSSDAIDDINRTADSLIQELNS